MLAIEAAVLERGEGGSEQVRRPRLVSVTVGVPLPMRLPRRAAHEATPDHIRLTTDHTATPSSARRRANRMQPSRLQQIARVAPRSPAKDSRVSSPDAWTGCKGPVLTACRD